MFLPDFSYHRARSLPEALKLLSKRKGDVKILAGGTDLLLQMKRGNVWGKPSPKHLVSLRGVGELGFLEAGENVIRIGANVTHRETELSAMVANELGALSDAVRQLASVQIRNVATIAGNICNAAPCADTAAPLMALGASARIASIANEREVDLKDLFLGPGKIDVNADEILKEICIPRPSDGGASAYLRVARREAMDITIVGTAVYLCCTPDEKRIRKVRIALNTVAPNPVRAYEAEEFLIGAPLNEESFRKAGSIAQAHVSPRTSFRSTAKYRREMVGVFVRRALLKALERIRGR